MRSILPKKLDPDPFRILTFQKVFNNDFFISDDEAKVLGHLPGKGKHKGLMGALLVEMPNKKTFQVGSGYVSIAQWSSLMLLRTIDVKVQFERRINLVKFDDLYSFFRFTDAQRAKPPPIGSIISYKYQELTDGGIPRFPTYLGIRIDAEWPPKKKNDK